MSEQSTVNHQRPTLSRNGLIARALVALFGPLTIVMHMGAMLLVAGLLADGALRLGFVVVMLWGAKLMIDQCAELWKEAGNLE